MSFKRSKHRKEPAKQFQLIRILKSWRMAEIYPVEERQKIYLNFLQTWVKIRQLLGWKFELNLSLIGAQALVDDSTDQNLEKIG